MKQVKELGDWWFTDEETHQIEYMMQNGGIYQPNQRIAAINHSNPRRTAIDVGANIGLWAKDFCNYFSHVICFEPVTSTREVLKKNLEGCNNKTIHGVGLGNKNEEVTIKILEGSSGHATITGEGDVILREENITIVPMDSFSFTDVDLIKVDCQGYEIEILRGATNTLKENSPVLCLETPVRDEAEIANFNEIEELLNGLGYSNGNRVGKETYWRKQWG